MSKARLPAGPIPALAVGYDARMRFAFLADIHANWPALEAVLEDLDEQGEIHQLYSLGDQIGYYPFPRECMEALLERRALCILGNHERYLLGKRPKGLRRMVIAAVEHAEFALTAGQLAYIKGLKERRKVRDLFLQVHGSPRDCDEYLEPDRYKANLRIFREQAEELSLCFFGHTHKPVVISRERQLTNFQRSQTVRLKPGVRYLINPGSVGQPRDRCPMASYAIYDSTNSKLHIRRVPYPYEETQDAVKACGLAAKLGERLALGK